MALAACTRRAVELHPPLAGATVLKHLEQDFEDQRIFHDRGRAPLPGSVTYAGKLALAKGLHPLLDAFQQLHRDRPAAHLFVAGGGSGSESDALRARIESAPWATALGRLPPTDLAAHLRTSEVFVLPSFSEGQPISILEAFAASATVISPCSTTTGA